MRYLLEQQIILLNKKAVSVLRVKKADSFKVLSYAKLKSVVASYKKASGDVLDKSVILLKGLLQEHVFASANRRTAIVALITFTKLNGVGIVLHFEPRVIQGIREGYYSDEEIKQWLQGCEIHEFKR